MSSLLLLLFLPLHEMIGDDVDVSGQHQQQPNRPDGGGDSSSPSRTSFAPDRRGERSHGVKRVIDSVEKKQKRLGVGDRARKNDL